MSAAALAHDWHADRLRQRLLPLLALRSSSLNRSLSVEVLASCTSTNTLLIERARQAGGDFAPCLLVAEQQTAGRGRLGRSWLSAAGASLTFSIALPLAPRNWSGLSLAVGLALAEALDPLPESTPNVPARPRIMLKWPNDLWLADATGLVRPQKIVSGRKLGGVLVETLSAGDQRICVVGVGLNILPLPQSAHEQAAGLTSGYACLQELQPALRAPEVLAAVALPVMQALCAFEAAGFAPRVEAYAARDLLRGQPVGTSLPQWPAGVAEGVDAAGALVLRVGSERQRIVSGEVSVRPAERAGERAEKGVATQGAAAA